MSINTLKEWFIQHRRALPWRDNACPYAVWVSEVMLQQTQVAVVIPYFERWMQRFPTVQALANAQIEEVIKLWEGLGYYSRARNLHAGANYVLEKFNGVIPSNAEALQQIKGLGPYTVGAIRAFAFKQKASAVDGNVLRVFARYYNIHDPINAPATLKRLRVLAEEWLPDDRPWLVTEGLIELGATVCSRQPQCERCPLQTSCQAFANNTQHELPKKDRKNTTQHLYRSVAVVMSPTGLLLRKCQEGEIMSDLHEFPYLEIDEDGIHHNAWSTKFDLKLEWHASLSPVTHTFTRYRVRLDPVIFRCAQSHTIKGYQWYNWKDIPQLAFSSGHRKILMTVLKEQMT